MPYFIYKIDPQAFELIKSVEFISQFDKFKEARNQAHDLREEAANTKAEYKVVFAENRLDAEEKLLEKRDKPILMEHEK